MENSLSKLESAVARMEGIVTTEIKHLGHDVKNLSAKMDAQVELFVPRKEIDARAKDFNDRLAVASARIADVEDAAEKRADKLEGWIIKLLWSLGAVGAVSAGFFYAVGRKLGFTS